MTTIFVWLGSGFAFSVGVCVGAYAMRSLVDDRPWKSAIQELQERANELLEERNVIGERLAEYMRQIADNLGGRNQ